MGTNKSSGAGGPDFSTSLARFYSGASMFLEDYGRLGPTLMNSSDFSVFMWVKTSSSYINFEVMSLSQPLVQNAIPMFALDFEGTGKNHYLKCFWA